MEHTELLQKIPEPLLRWYDAGARVLPWRENPEPYRVWVSEIMLQQTRVEAVKPYYERFLTALPTVRDLAEAPEEQLLKLWEGLGYYSRVRNLQKGARAVMERFGGQIPASFEDLRSLPGIGDYTAGAIASIAFGIRRPAVDGNVLRVVSRLLCSRDDILDPKVKRDTEAAVTRILPERVGDFNQSLMELGAMVCLPNGAPKCLTCPLREICLGYASGEAASLPVKAPKKARSQTARTLILLFCGKKAALQKRPGKGLLAGMWEPPAAEGTLSQQEARAHLEGLGVRVLRMEPLPPSRHIFTHTEWRMSAWRAETDAEAGPFTWAEPAQLRGEYALPSAFKAYLPCLLRE